jgi:heme a synthase
MSNARRVVVLWLGLVCATVFAMIVVGGVTRLTESGLSIVEWQPVMGVVPPLNQAEWEAAFEAYKQYPQYRQLNESMDLSGFKQIYFWEYTHRLLGRLIGVIFVLPFLLLWWRGMIERAWLLPLSGALVLGGLQGLLGWYMVKSGLIDMPRVSHYRLAAHLLLALFILAYLFWMILDLCAVKRCPSRSRWVVWSLAAVAGLQLFYGALTAGIRAGYGFNTFPKMLDKWVADAVFFMQPWWINLFESSATIQFVHRWLGAALLVLSFATWLTLRSADSRLKWAAAMVFGAIMIQFTLGVLTLVHVVPIGLASLHQAWACVMLLSIVHLLYITSPSRR